MVLAPVKVDLSTAGGDSVKLIDVTDIPQQTGKKETVKRKPVFDLYITLDDSASFIKKIKRKFLDMKAFFKPIRAKMNEVLNKYNGYINNYRKSLDENDIFASVYTFSSLMKLQEAKEEIAKVATQNDIYLKFFMLTRRQALKEDLSTRYIITNEHTPYQEAMVRLPKIISMLELNYRSDNNGKRKMLQYILAYEKLRINDILVTVDNLDAYVNNHAFLEPKRTLGYWQSYLPGRKTILVAVGTTLAVEAAAALYGMSDQAPFRDTVSNWVNYFIPPRESWVDPTTCPNIYSEERAAADLLEKAIVSLTNLGSNLATKVGEIKKNIPPSVLASLPSLDSIVSNLEQATTQLYYYIKRPYYDYYNFITTVPPFSRRAAQMAPVYGNQTSIQPVEAVITSSIGHIQKFATAMGYNLNELTETLLEARAKLPTSPFFTPQL